MAKGVPGECCAAVLKKQGVIGREDVSVGRSASCCAGQSAPIALQFRGRKEAIPRVLNGPRERDKQWDDDIAELIAERVVGRLRRAGAFSAAQREETSLVGSFEKKSRRIPLTKCNEYLLGLS